MRIAIIGTRGIPNHYGGFEQCAEYLAVGLVQKGFNVTVYNSHDHPFQQSTLNGVKIVHCFDPENIIGATGQFIYDLNCIIDTRKKEFDIILQLGYTSNSVWGWLLPNNTVVTTNMDGLEWKRTKYSNLIKKFLLYAEKLGVKYSDYLISDSVGIQDYIYEKYKKESVFIPYGAHLFNDYDAEVLKEFSLTEYNYDLLIARLEPENSIEVILDGVVEANNNITFLVIGKHDTSYGKLLKNKYRSNTNIHFLGGIYDINKLNNIRHYSRLYFHGHTVGGTNPSLLEAMAANSLICANDNPFNKYILGDDALYFSNASQVASYILNVNHNDAQFELMMNRNRTKISDIYSWDNIVNKYANHFYNIAGNVFR
jgi:glycosyltransferase involved in cell wall biosynthesis